MKESPRISSDSLSHKLVTNESNTDSSCDLEPSKEDVHIVVRGTEVPAHQHPHPHPHPPAPQQPQPQPHPQQPRVFNSNLYNDSCHGFLGSDGKGTWSLCDAYLLSIPFAGFLGGHHFYLRRPQWGLLYIFTFAFLGFGLVVDLFRMPWLIKRAQKEAEARNRNLIANLPPPIFNCDLVDAYILTIPLGFLGFQHFYLGRFRWGLLYFLTFGLLGVGWAFDMLRMPWLVEQTNLQLEFEAKDRLQQREYENMEGGRQPSLTPMALPVATLPVHVEEAVTGSTSDLSKAGASSYTTTV